MNNFFLAYNLWSFRDELKLVLYTFLLVLSLPIIAVLVITNAGIQEVSDALVSVNTQARTVQILNPATGEVVKEVSGDFFWPVQGVITLEFGQSSGYQLFHTGIDVADPEGEIGDQIYPFMPGMVIYSGETSWGYGKHVVIDNGDNISSIYAHLNKISVAKGQEVTINPIGY